MNFWTIISNITSPVVSFSQSNPLIAIAALIVMAFLIYRKPYFFMVVFLIGLLILGALYFIMSASSSEVPVKERMIQEEEMPRNISKAPGLMF